MKNLFITGRITKDAVLQKTKTGIDAVSFNVAVNGRAKRDEQGNYLRDANGYKVYDTEYYQVQLYREFAVSMAPYLKKGREIDVSGSNFRLSSWTGRDNRINPTIIFTNPELELKGGAPAKAEEPASGVDDLPFDD